MDGAEERRVVARILTDVPEHHAAELLALRKSRLGPNRVEAIKVILLFDIDARRGVVSVDDFGIRHLAWRTLRPAAVKWHAEQQLALRHSTRKHLFDVGLGLGKSRVLRP